MDTQDKLWQFIDNGRWFLDNLPDLILIKDIESTCLEFSQNLCDLLTMNKKELIGRSDYDLPWENFAELYRHYDQKVLMGERVISLQPMQINKNSVLTAKIIKFPIIDNSGKIIGIWGQANILSSNNELGQLLSTLILKDEKNTALSNCSPKAYQIDCYNSALKLTQREIECLFLLIRGKSAKEIGRFLEISPRTVEEYINNVKDKMDVSTRSQIITKSIEMGMLDIIPKNDMLIGLYKNIDKLKDFLMDD